jgi:hypothetical protein
MANTTHTSVMAMSIGHSSSAYSLPDVIPSGSEMAADRMIPCHAKKWTFARRSEGSRAFSRRCEE